MYPELFSVYYKLKISFASWQADYWLGNPSHTAKGIQQKNGDLTSVQKKKN